MSDSAVDQTEQSSERQWEPEDKLNRKEASQFLTRYLTGKFESESQGDALGSSFVLNINAHWGFGKTYFLTNWAEDLRLTGYPVVFFNAWENDCFDDPMVAFISEIQSTLEKYLPQEGGAAKQIQPLVKKGRKLLKVGLPILASLAAKKLTGYALEQVVQLYQDADSQTDDDKAANSRNAELEKVFAKISEDVAKKAIKDYEQSKRQIKDFKETLKTLVLQIQESQGKKAPLFIFIDELDRCRPTYAIEVLEKVKHIFDIPGVYFVVATASGQLCYSIKAVYGEGFDAESYLKRFFDQIYEFEKPDYFSFSNYLFAKHGLGDQKGRFFSPLLKEKDSSGREIDKNIRLFALFAEHFQLGLRDQEQVAKNLMAVCLGWRLPGKIHLAWLLFLMVTKHRLDDAFVELEKRPDLIDGVNNPLKYQALTVTVSFRNAFDNRGTNIDYQDYPLGKLVKTYSKLMQKDRSVLDGFERGGGDLYEKAIYSQCLEDIGDFPYNKKDFLKLRQYYWYVKQIGRFTTDMTKGFR